MHDLYNDLYDMCETLSRELKKANQKIEKSGGEISAGDLEYIDKLTHALKSVKTTKAMVEAEEEGMSYEGGSYARGGQGGGQGGSQPRGSYARRSYEQGGGSYGSYARGRNARRDSMGRYSSEMGYSGNEEMISELRELMEDAPDEKTRMEFQKFISKIENM